VIEPQEIASLAAHVASSIVGRDQLHCVPMAA
jgi:hypothetical protein